MRMLRRLRVSDPKILYAIVFKDENGQEWLDGTNQNGDALRLNLMPSEFALSVYTDVYGMRKTAETMGSSYWL
jgi:hypothetical protein